MDLDLDDDEVPIKIFGLKSESSKSNSSSSPKNMCAVRKVTQSRKLLAELKDCHSVSSSLIHYFHSVICRLTFYVQY
jgi:hypothetical protein